MIKQVLLHRYHNDFFYFFVSLSKLRASTPVNEFGNCELTEALFVHIVRVVLAFKSYCSTNKKKLTTQMQSKGPLMTGDASTIRNGLEELTHG